MDFYLTFGWDKTSEEIFVEVEIPAGAYLAVAFGQSLEKCDMILFQAMIDAPLMSDCSYEEGVVEYLDQQQDWISEVIDYGSRYHKLFKARRVIDTGDPDDFIFQLDREMIIGYQYSKDGTDFEPHKFEN